MTKRHAALALLAGLAAVSSAHASLTNPAPVHGDVTTAGTCPGHPHVIYPEASHINYPSGACQFTTAAAASGVTGQESPDTASAAPATPQTALPQVAR